MPFSPVKQAPWPSGCNSSGTAVFQAFFASAKNAVTRGGGYLSRQRNICWIAIVIVGLLSANSVAFSEDPRSNARDHSVLWRNPGSVERLDLAGGSGGKANTPRPPFTFLEE